MDVSSIRKMLSKDKICDYLVEETAQTLTKCIIFICMLETFSEKLLSSESMSTYLSVFK